MSGGFAHTGVWVSLPFDLPVPTPATPSLRDRPPPKRKKVVKSGQTAQARDG